MKDSKKKDIDQRLYELRRQSRERHLKLMGVDVPALRKLEQTIDKDFGELADQVKKRLREAGSDVREMHAMSLKRSERVFQSEIARAIAPDLGITKLQCFCLSFFTASHVGKGNDPAVISPASGGTGSASVTWGTDCEGHPIVDAKGQGTGTTNSAELTSHCRFAFTPSSDGTYCIVPYVYMNGHYLVWTWGTCSGTAEDLGTASAGVRLDVQIDQLGVPVKTIQHAVVDVSVSGGSDTQSGFAYDSEIDGGARTSVFLEGGHEAIVWVKCTSFAEVVNHGRAWVDMQTSPQFYFKVVQMRWGPIICWPWWKTLTAASVGT